MQFDSSPRLALPRMLFGGPDRPYQILRDTLESLVDDAPAGSAIDWATYYFRDMRLASSLIRASNRGVSVRVVLEPNPRLRGANDQVLMLLQEHGLAGGLRMRARLAGLGQLHSKAYVFSHARVALVGSFNPSSNGTSEDQALREIGDQDRGYNLLVRIDDPELVAALSRYIGWLGDASASPLDRFRRQMNQTIGSAAIKLHFYPRLRTRLVEGDIARLGAGDCIHAGLSHMKAGSLVKALIAARAKGAQVALFAHSTERRIPSQVVEALTTRGISITRVGDSERVPMHNKFILVTRAGRHHAWLGSYNYNAKSRWLNDELLVWTDDQAITESLLLRFEEMRIGAPQAARAKGD